MHVLSLKKGLSFHCAAFDIGKWVEKEGQRLFFFFLKK